MSLAKYGITERQYRLMLRRQKGRCSICGTLPKKRRLAVDHCHLTGRVRGLLCYHCNRFWVAKNTAVNIEAVYQYVLAEFDGRTL